MKKMILWLFALGVSIPSAGMLPDRADASASSSRKRTADEAFQNDEGLKSNGNRSCNLCHHVAAYPSLLAEHKASHSSSRSRVYTVKCPNCPLYFKAKRTVTFHKEHSFCTNTTGSTKRASQESACQAKEKILSCDLCLHTTRFKGVLKSHNKIHSEQQSNSHTHQCNNCSLWFTTDQGLMYHSRGRCKTPNKVEVVALSELYSCGSCRFTHTNKDTFRLHSNVHSCEKSKTHSAQCEDCKLWFTEDRGLGYHLNDLCLQRVVRNGTCISCNYTSNNINDILKHEQIHSSTFSQGTFTIPCHDCDLWFSSNKARGYHSNKCRRTKKNGGFVPAAVAAASTYTQTVPDREIESDNPVTVPTTIATETTLPAPLPSNEEESNPSDFETLLRQQLEDQNPIFGSSKVTTAPTQTNDKLDQFNKYVDAMLDTKEIPVDPFNINEETDPISEDRVLELLRDNTDLNN